jgi:hypothetical protein
VGRESPETTRSLRQGRVHLPGEGRGRAPRPFYVVAATCCCGNRPRLLGNSGDMAEAQRVFRNVERRWPMRGSTQNLEGVRKWLAAEGGPGPPGQMYRLRRLPRRAVQAGRR